MRPATLPLILAAALGLAATPLAAAPRVVADIAPVHSIIARVMDGAGTPELLMPPGASPHGYALRPSEAARLDAAEIVFWIGPDLTPWLEGPLDALAPGAAHVELARAEGVTVLPMREGGPFEAHDHDHDHDHDHADHAGHDHDDHDHAHDDHDHAAEHAHAHDDDHAHDHAHDHGHAEGAADGHLWLDPANAAAIAAAVAAELAALDPENAALYAANAAAFAGELTALSAEIDAGLAPLRGRPFVVFHDAYQYFEAAFHLPAAGSISLGEADAPSAARVAEIRDRIAAEGVVCVFAEPQFEPRLVATVIEGSAARSGVLDPIGADLDPGPGLYPALLTGLAQGLADCLGG
jgi:zinc transport system substrate-binding protein